MIIGSGMIASGLVDRSDVIQYAAGVSNSQCTDEEEFTRDKERLVKNLSRPGLFVYFSTCSEEDTPYVRHKRECEALIKRVHLICRLPTVSGNTPNPHTLLNFLYAKISRSEKFDLYPDARRNIIDIVDVGTIVRMLLNRGDRGIVNVAAPMDYSMREIVAAFEKHLGKKAIYKEHEGGSQTKIEAVESMIDWSGDYLGQILWKRYR
jgi:hypothetical protein